MESKMKRNLSYKLLGKKRNNKMIMNVNNNKKVNRFLISINVLGSAGPIRFIANEGDVVNDVIDTALKTYAREGRLPLLGSDVHSFLLCSPNGDVLEPWEAIGKSGQRKFILCRKQLKPSMKLGRSEMIAKRPVSNWKAWLKNLNFKILSHQLYN